MMLREKTRSVERLWTLKVNLPIMYLSCVSPPNDSVTFLKSVTNSASSSHLRIYESYFSFKPTSYVQLYSSKLIL